MSHSRSTSKDKDGNDDNNKSQDDNISEVILHQKDSKCTVSVCIFRGGAPGALKHLHDFHQNEYLA